MVEMALDQLSEKEVVELDESMHFRCDQYKFRTILLQLIWALVLTATLNPFELGVILLPHTSPESKGM